KVEKEPSAQERYQALVKDFTTQQREMVTEIRKAKGPEQQKLIQKYMALGGDFAEKFYKLAEDDPKGPAGVDALFWIVQNASGSPTYQKASGKITSLIGEMPLADLNR